MDAWNANLRLGLLAVLLNAVAACTQAAPRRLVVSHVAAPAAPATTPAPAPPTRASLVEARCAELTARHRDALLAFPAGSAFHEAGASREEDRSLEVEGLGVCSETEGGVWSIVAAAPRGTPVEGLLHLELAYLPLERASESAAPAVLPLTAISPGTTENPQLGASAFDYDGDGLPELFVSVERRDDSEDGGACIPYGSRRESWLVSVRRAGPALTIAPVEPAPGATILTVTDADADGRPDFVVADPYELGATVCTSDDAPGWLAHSLPGGTFSLDDDVAQRFARASCENVDAPAVGFSLLSVACARVMGATQEAVERDLRLRCASRVSRRSPACAALPELLRAAALRPPVVSPR